MSEYSGVTNWEPLREAYKRKPKKSNRLKKKKKKNLPNHLQGQSPALIP